MTDLNPVDAMTTDYRAMCAELVNELHGYASANPHHDSDELVARARALLAQPVAEGPTDEELLRVAATAIDPYESSGIALGEYEPETECAVEAYGSELIAYARAALARWGNSQAILDSSPQPVAASERLPGPEDCDAEGRCWVHQPHEACPESPAWELMRAKYASANYGAVCWLPANALPTPEAQP